MIKKVKKRMTRIKTFVNKCDPS